MSVRAIPSALLLSLLAACLAAAGGGCSRKPSRNDCEKLVDHLIDLEATAGGASAATPEQKAQLEQQKKKVMQSIGLDFCLKEMSVDQVKCGLKARTLDDIGKTCDRS